MKSVLVNNRSRGTVTLVVLLMLVLFALITIASIQFIARQSHDTTGQEVVGKSFGLADSGVQFILWMIRQDQINVPDPLDPDSYPASFVQVNPIDYLEEVSQREDGKYVKGVIEDDPSDVVGQFEAKLKSINEDRDQLTVTIMGRDYQREIECQTVDVEYKKDTSDPPVFQIVDWEYVYGSKCELNHES